MRSQLRYRLAYATALTAVAGMFFGLAGNIDNFPSREVGFGIFLVGVFATALLLFGKVD